MKNLTYRQSRMLVLSAGSVVLLIIAAVLLARAQDPVEVVAVVLFLPVFVAAVLGGIRWGIATAVIAAGIYVVLRLDVVDQFGWEPVAGRIAGQAIAYLAFGALAGWAAGIVSAGITKLDRFDVRDDDSELLNARGVHEQLEQEVARARRYDSDFAVVMVTFPLTGDKRERRKQIGDIVRSSVRTVDDTGRITMDGKDVLLAVLPETPPEGAEVVGNKIAEQLERDVAHIDTEVRWLAHPEDDDEIAQLLGRLEQIVHRQHPEAVRQG